MVEKHQFCFIDFDIDAYRSKLLLAASFVDATDTRYGFSSKDLRHLGGSEISRIEELLLNDHEWSPRVADVGGVAVRPPRSGNRIIVKLNWEVAPLACENFSTICKNSSMPEPKIPVGQSGKPLSYKDSVVHRIVTDFVMQCGDFVFGNGSGGESIFGGKKFKDERGGLALKHDRRGILSMGNSGKNSNTSQFFLTFGSVPQCDGKHVVFGEIISGFEVLAAIEAEGSSSGEPRVPVTITACGVHEPFVTPPAGYWYDKPDDSYNGFSPVFMCRPRVLVLAPTSDVCAKFKKQLSSIATLTFIVSEEHKNDANDNEIANKTVSLLQKYAIDLVIVAPACRNCAPSQLPDEWQNIAATELSLDDVVLISKPLDCALKLQDRKSVV